MTKNLFLTGTKRSGKSTLLKDCLYPYRQLIGGYYIQRIYDHNSDTLAYRILDISSNPFYNLNVTEAIYEHTDIIAITSQQKKEVRVFPSALTEKGVHILNSVPKSKRIVLMDELGKFELRAPLFMQTVFTILKSPVPVIGVLKKEPNSFLTQISERHADLILDLDLTEYMSCKKSIEDFLHDNLAFRP